MKSLHLRYEQKIKDRIGRVWGNQELRIANDK